MEQLAIQSFILQKYGKIQLILKHKQNCKVCVVMGLIQVPFKPTGGGVAIGGLANLGPIQADRRRRSNGVNPSPNH